MKATLHLKLLGPPDIRLDGKPVAEVLSNKAQAVLYYLAVTGQPQPRSILATLLWGETPEEAARDNLRKALADLRRVADGHLDIGRHSVALKGTGIWIDVAEFEAIVSNSSLRVESSADARRWQDAVDLYRGDFLTGFYALHAPDFETWLLSEQARLRESVVQVLHLLANFYSTEEEPAQAIACIRRLLKLEPWREEGHRQLMLLLARDGQRSAALAQYETCRQVLQEELGVEPGPETTALYERIRDGKLSRQYENFSSPVPAKQRNEEIFSPASLPSYSPPFVQNLPSPSTPFVGRAAELADVIRRLTDRDCRLLTLVGPGGIGKTRLALRAAQTFVDIGADEGFFAHGIIFVSLAGISSIGGMISAIAEAASFTFYSNVPPRQQLLNYLQEKIMLLVLDNLEHLLDVGSELISEILAVAPQIKILVTSREALKLQEAWFHPVAGMSFPAAQVPSEPGNGSGLGSSMLEKYDAIRLFVQCASRVRVEFSLAAEQAHIVRICQLVEGMPLGIELAAAWLKMLPAGKIVYEIEQGLDILSTRLQNVPQRHHSIRAVFEHSWHLLTEEEQEVLKRLSVFRGSFTEKAAEEVTEASLLILATLVEKSLVRVTGRGRYQLHELLRQFTGEKLTSDQQVEAVTRERHSACYLDLLRAREEMLINREQPRALAEIGEEIENIELAWRWAVGQDYLAAIDQSMESLYNFYQIRSRYQEGKESFAYTIRHLEVSGLLAEHPELKTVLNRLQARLGCFYFFLGDYEIAHSYLKTSLELARQANEKELILRMLGEVALAQGQRSVAEEQFRRSLAISREIGNLHGVAETLRGLAGVASSFGEFAEAQQLAGESLAISRRIGQPIQIARTLISLSWPINCLGGYREAEEYVQESLVICQEIDDRLGIEEGFSFLGWAAWSYGGARLEEAAAYHQQALAICRQIGHRRNLTMSLGDLSLTLIDLGEYEQAGRYSREGLATATEMGHLDHMAYNSFCLGAAACGLNDFQTSRDYLIKSLKISWQAQIITHLTVALFYFATLLTKEGERAEVTEPIKLQQRIKALELLALVTHHPACWQPVKDRAVALQTQLEAAVSPDLVNTAKIRAKARKLEEIIRELQI